MITLFFSSCSSTKPEPDVNEKNNTEEETNEKSEQTNLFIENAEPFYPIKETVEDILVSACKIGQQIYTSIYSDFDTIL